MLLHEGMDPPVLFLDTKLTLEEKMFQKVQIAQREQMNVVVKVT